MFGKVKIIKPQGQIIISEPRTTEKVNLEIIISGSLNGTKNYYTWRYVIKNGATTKYANKGKRRTRYGKKTVRAAQLIATIEALEYLAINFPTIPAKVIVSKGLADIISGKEIRRTKHLKHYINRVRALLDKTTAKVVQKQKDLGLRK